MRIPTLPAILILCASAAFAQEEAKPLTALPYTPSLDVTSMDRTVNPCEDFFRFSCGNWIRKNPIPADQASWDVYSKLATDNRQYLWGILLEAGDDSRPRKQEEQQIGDLFHACMDEGAIEKVGLKPLRPALDAIAALKSKKEIAALVAGEHVDSGSSALFNFGSNQDFADSQQVIAFAGAGGLGLPDRDYYVKTDAKSVETREKYVQHVARMFELLGEDAAKAKADAAVVMAIETELARASLTQVEKRDPYNLFHKLPAADFQALTPDFAWDTYYAHVGLARPAVVNATEPAFFKALEQQLTAHKLADWQTYLRWHLIHSQAHYLPAAFDQEDFSFFSKYLQGVEQMPPRWKRCVSLVDRSLGEAMGRVYVAKTFSPEAKQVTLKMTKEIEEAMAGEIRTLPWMGEETKKHALEKLHTIVNKIGYPDKWRDYSSVVIQRDDYLGDVARATAFESHRQLAKIGKPVNRAEWDMTPPTVNAYYNPQMNDINFPAGVLQPPLFDLKIDMAPSYGDTGGTIGHELTHGFDDEGRQFDAQGNLKDWWTKKDAEEFEKRVNCVRDQYGQYTVVDDIKINSKLTSGEDVADIGGTLLAWLAWKASTAGQKLEPVDGLTPEQRFYVGYAQWACGSERPEMLRLHAITDPHSPLQYRVNGVMADLPDFATAFACKAGQPMVRADACRIW
ncbi:MAG TPA: M13 family metallopeptidase [Bryobacteraceae bacterium]|nr:M13 family metallopeptidase [Bryobacteraceae bacterium]